MKSISNYRKRVKKQEKTTLLTRQMRKLFVDTNIVIDLLSKREPFFKEAAFLFSLADKKKIQLTISSLTIANASDVLLRQMNWEKAKSVLRKLRLLVRFGYFQKTKILKTSSGGNKLSQSCQKFERVSLLIGRLFFNCR
jgi:hypothetical protein